MPQQTRRGRTIMALLAGTVLLPVAFTGLGVWESYRGDADVATAVRLRDRLAPIVATLEARQARGAPDRFDMGLQFRRGDKFYGGPLAVTEAREELSSLDTARWLAVLRTWLPPVVVATAGIAAALSVAALCTAALLGRAGRHSRDALLRGFSFIRRALPTLMGAQVMLMAVAFVAVVAFESMALLDVDEFSAGGFKLLGIGVVVAAISLWTAFRAVLQLRRTVAAFTPDPMPIDGRLVSPAEAPGLWALVGDLAGRLGALQPDNLVVGLTGGFFVSSGPKWLRPAGTALSGRTLYIPLPTLPLLRADEVATIVGHELAHFSGGDTDWSQRFLPIYAGVERSLDAVATAATGEGGAASPLVSPSLRLGQFAMEQFHWAVRHWSRVREFAADAAGAAATSPDAAARALVRISALQPRIEEVLDPAAHTPAEAPADLVAAAFDNARVRGLDDPATHLEDEQPHPTDTHPPTRQRLAALGQAVTPALLAEAAAAPAADGLSRLGAWFADPGSLSRAATTDFLSEVAAQRLAQRNALQATADRVLGEDQVLHENTRVVIVLGIGAALLALLGLAMLALGMPGLDATEQRIFSGVAVLLAAGLALRAWYLSRRARVPFMVLRPDAMELPGLDRPIAWKDLADLDITITRSGLVTRMLLPPEAAFPVRLPGARRLRLDAKRGIVTVKAMAPRRMTAQAYATLIGQYRRAAQARRLLQDDTTGACP